MALNFKEGIEEKLKMVLSKLGLAEESAELNPVFNFDFGDYSTTVALAGAKKLRIDPKTLAALIKEKMMATGLSSVKKIETAGPGFVNFYLADELLAENIREILKQGDNYGHSQDLADKKIMIEFTDPNPFKEFHIGHLMTNTIGEALARIIAAAAAEVKQVNYQGDVGLHVAKTIWALQKNIDWPITVETLAAAYTVGSRAYDRDEAARKEIAELNKKIYDRSDRAINRLYNEGRAISLKHFEDIYQRLDTNFDFNFFESITGEFGRQVVLEFLNQGVFEKSDGAIVFPGDKYGLHTRVFVTSQDLPTYEAKELGLAKIKYNHFPYDQSLVITGNEINDYFKVLLKAMSLVYPKLAAKTVHIGHGMLRLPSGKMSSRTGEVIVAEALIEEVKTAVRAKMETDSRAGEATEAIAEQVTIGAIKYSILKQDIGKDIIFDFDKSISFEGNAGPYLQYMRARTASVLSKSARPAGADFAAAETPGNLERLLIRYPETVRRAGRELEPHHLATYLFQLASAFGSYYAKEKIIGSPAENYRLALSAACGQVLKNGLDLLGIKSPERM